MGSGPGKRGVNGSGRLTWTGPVRSPEFRSRVLGGSEHVPTLAGREEEWNQNRHRFIWSGQNHVSIRTLQETGPPAPTQLLWKEP